ncbi:MAG TPA: GNAT family N-acetyltransferase [Thermoleophilaceae bacterium]|nr:GNAT family N-acetyltransferase [Thermoleophilaceae bacterium]
MVRRAEAGDLDGVTRLIAEFRDWWGKAEPSAQVIGEAAAQLLDHDHTEFLLAFDDGEPVGVCQLRYRLSVWTGVEDCWLEDLFVTQSARGARHGRELVEAAFESARARGCRRMELDVNEQNTAALRFYEGLGFTTEPKPPGRTLFISRPL